MYRRVSSHSRCSPRSQQTPVGRGNSFVLSCVGLRGSFCCRPLGSGPGFAALLATALLATVLTDATPTNARSLASLAHTPLATVLADGAPTNARNLASLGDADILKENQG